jgi:hypothetical protein
MVSISLLIAFSDEKSDAIKHSRYNCPDFRIMNNDSIYRRSQMPLSILLIIGISLKDTDTQVGNSLTSKMAYQWQPPVSGSLHLCWIQTTHILREPKEGASSIKRYIESILLV